MIRQSADIELCRNYEASGVDVADRAPMRPDRGLEAEPPVLKEQRGVGWDVMLNIKRLKGDTVCNMSKREISKTWHT